MADNSLKQVLSSFLILSIGSFGLLSLDLEYRGGNGFSWSSASLLNFVWHPQQINSELLETTSLKGLDISSSSSSDEFFDGYLKVPEDISVQHYEIPALKLKISEISMENPYELIKTFTQQQSEHFKLNVINSGTFYLNQEPISTKTHNFLGIILKNTLFGFQYPPLEHQKVLEIIDAIQQNK